MNTAESRRRRDTRIALATAEERLAAAKGIKPESPPQEPAWRIRFEAFPDPWLFDSQKLLCELDRCRELVIAIPNTNDRHATHFAREIAITAIWNLRETLRYLLAVHREGQREFAKKVVRVDPPRRNATTKVLRQR